MIRSSYLLSTGLLVFVSSTLAQLPYNPTKLLLSPDGSKVYQFTGQSSQPALSVLDISSQVDSSNTASTIFPSLPFQSNSSLPYLPIANDAGLSVLVGDCGDAGSSRLWSFTPNTSQKNGTWKKVDISGSGSSTNTNWLSAGFSFSPTLSVNDTSIYTFGGMCPSGSSNSSSWTSQASYSSILLSATPNDASKSYTLTTARSSPIAEAGLTITPLSPVFSNSSMGKIVRQQNFVLLGGHTQNAFINMSQVAVYALPEAAWAFVGVNQPSSVQGDLVKRDSIVVEPRSGHTAVLTEDGSKVVVFGGWVGDVTTPASPQLAVLEIGENYGGSGPWAWTIPSQTASPFTTGQGIYGHGAIMLPGGVMMISGGTNIVQSRSKRAITQNYMFYNTTSSTWSSSYKNPSATENSDRSSSGGLNSSQKAGIGAGLGLGVAAVIGIAAFWFLYARRLKRKRVERERRLRELALGSGRYQSYPNLSSGVDGRGGYPEMRSASWGNAQEKHVGSRGDMFPWAPVISHGQAEALRLKEDQDITEANHIEADTDIPSPSTGLRRSLHSKGPAGFGNHFGIATHDGRGSVFRIDEEEEERSIKSGRKTPSRASDPFKDPPLLKPRDTEAEKRKKEVQGWVEDWQSAAESLSRNPSQARTYSNLSQAHSNSNSNSDKAGRSSPEKSDRTGSNLSERSNFSTVSFQKSTTGTISRTLSQRSASAGYALFAGAAAAMSKLSGTHKEPEIDRSASKRSVSLNSGHPRTTRPVTRETQALLRDVSPVKSERHSYWTPPESPIKDYKNYARTSSLTSQGKVKARGVLGSFKRVLTGTSQVDVQAHVEQYEDKEKEAEETQVPEMSETLSRRTSNPGVPFWQGKKGAKDWSNENQVNSTSTVRRRSSGVTREEYHGEEYDGEEWDVETAIQRRVVQVMFTVPKEKLRVVNADALSLISRSDVGGDDSPDIDVKRMSSVKESEEDTTGNEKGKEKQIE